MLFNSHGCHGASLSASERGPPDVKMKAFLLAITAGRWDDSQIPNLAVT
jgi:hypothetical protein